MSNLGRAILSLVVDSYGGLYISYYNVAKAAAIANRTFSQARDYCVQLGVVAISSLDR